MWWTAMRPRKRPAERDANSGNQYRIMKKWIIATVLVAAVSCGRNPDGTERPDYRMPEPESFIEGIGKVIPQNDLVEVTAEVSGRVVAAAKTGACVKSGEVLVRLEASDAAQDVASARDRLATQRSRVREAETALLKSRMEYENTKEEAEKAGRLFEKGAETAQNAVTLENDCQIRKISMDEKENALSTARCLLSECEDELQAARLRLAKYTITAPGDGKVLELGVRTGNTVRPYDVLAVFAPDEARIVLAEMDEIFASMLKVGQGVTVFPVGYENEIATGRVYEMSDMLAEKSIFSGSNTERQDRRIRKIRIMLDDQKDPPLIGKKVTCRIHLK